MARKLFRLSIIGSIVFSFIQVLNLFIRGKYQHLQKYIHQMERIELSFIISSEQGSPSKENRITNGTIIQPYEGWKNMDELGIDSFKARTFKGVKAVERIETIRKPGEELKVLRSHYIYNKHFWDGAPIVIPKYKLIFFTIPKVGCSVFKKLFRRMEGYSDWLSKSPHDPASNGLRYLHHYPLDAAQQMLTSPLWMRAIFLREPKERILSAYLEKGKRKHLNYVNNHCCHSQNSTKCRDIASDSFEGFLQIAHSCPDPHWFPLVQRMEGRYWPYMDFVGQMEKIREDAKTLLQHLGAWDEYGAFGWGDNGTEAIFQSRSIGGHNTAANEKMKEYYTKEAEAMVEDMFAQDYNNFLLLGYNISETRLFIS